MFVAYLDEFGHIGPYVSRSDPRFNTHPCFGLAGIVLPDHRVRAFATWFYKLKGNLLKFEIDRSGEDPWHWEKKGSALFTTQTFTRYPQVRLAMFRILNQIEQIGGFVWFVGIGKSKSPGDSSSEGLYAAMLRQSIQRIDREADAAGTDFILTLDESDEKFHRNVIMKKARKVMYGEDFCKHLIEPPFQVCSHLYQTLQCADWVCGLVGRMAAYQADPHDFAEFEWADRYFGDRIRRVSRRSGVRLKPPGPKMPKVTRETVTISTSITTATIGVTEVGLN